MSPQTLRIVALLASLALAVWACGPLGPDPCDDDLFACRSDSPGTLEFDESCTLTGELELEAGWGIDAFHPLDESDPLIYYGSQGGSHVFLAARLHNGDLRDHPEIEIRFSLYQVLSLEACAETLDRLRRDDPERLPEQVRNDPSAGPELARPLIALRGDLNTEALPLVGPSRCVSSGEERVLVVAAGAGIEVHDEGAADVYGVFVPLPYAEYGATLGVHVSATDPCRRTGNATSTFLNP